MEGRSTFYRGQYSATRVPLHAPQGHNHLARYCSLACVTCHRNSYKFYNYAVHKYYPHQPKFDSIAECSSIIPAWYTIVYYFIISVIDTPTFSTNLYIIIYITNILTWIWPLKNAGNGREYQRGCGCRLGRD